MGNGGRRGRGGDSAEDCQRKRIKKQVVKLRRATSDLTSFGVQAQDRSRSIFSREAPNAAEMSAGFRARQPDRGGRVVRRASHRFHSGARDVKLLASDLWLKSIDGEKGDTTYTAHRVYDPVLFVESRHGELAKKGGSAVSITEAEYRKNTGRAS
jgi:hypothetical protein